MDTPTETFEFKPDKPIIGGLVGSKWGEWVPWTGGKPKADWSGLENSSVKELLRTMQICILTDKKYYDRI